MNEFLYYFFCDDEFPNLPDERKEQLLDEKGKHISRQTISKWIGKLENKNLILRSKGNANYYFSNTGTIIPTDMDTYLAAWHKYWIDRKNYNSGYAIDAMIDTYGGIAKKHLIPIRNKLEEEKINMIIDMVSKPYEYIG